MTSIRARSGIKALQRLEMLIGDRIAKHSEEEDKMEIIRNLTRRKLRNILTISGIVIGVLALVTMGSLAEKFNALLAGGATYFGSNIQVSDDTASAFGGFGGGGLLSMDKLPQIEAVNGVAAAFPNVSVSAKPGATNVVSFGVPDFIANTNPQENNYGTFHTHLAQGRDINADGTGEIVLGSDFASEFKKSVGDTIQLPIKPSQPPADFMTHTYTVVGILAKTQTAPDTGAYVSLTDAQTLLKESLPASVRNSIDISKLVNGITVYGNPGTNLDNLAVTINAQVPGVKATKPSDLVNSFNSGGALFTAITTGAALLALVVGGLSVVNTMLMAVSERVREIGLKKAVGARVSHILREYLAESMTIGLVAGLIGVALGWAVTSLLNAGNPQLGLFLLTWRLVILSLIFAIGLGAVAGIIPALRAARMDPVRALRAA